MLSWQRQPNVTILEKYNKLGCCNQSRAPARGKSFLLHRASGLFLSLNLVTPSPHSASTQSVQPVPITSLWKTPLKNSTGNLDLTLTGNRKTHTVQVWAHVWGTKDIILYSPWCYFETGPLTGLGVAIVRLAWLVSKPLGTSSPHHSSSGLQCYNARLFEWVLGFELRSTGLQGRHFTGYVIFSD